MQDNHHELGAADVVSLQQEVSHVIDEHHGACYFSWVKDILIVRGANAPDFLLHLMQSGYLDKLSCDVIKRWMPDCSVSSHAILHL